MSAMRITAAALALVMGASGVAQAEPFNIFSASKAMETPAGNSANLELVHRRHRHGGPGAAFALGAMGMIAGIAAANAHRGRYYCDPYYEYCGRRYYHRRYYYEPRYYYPRSRYYYYD